MHHSLIILYYSNCYVQTIYTIKAYKMLDTIKWNQPESPGSPAVHPVPVTEESIYTHQNKGLSSLHLNAISYIMKLLLLSITHALKFQTDNGVLHVLQMLHKY